LLPSARSILSALLLLVGAACAYVVARETSVFAVRTVAVTGAPPGVVAQVRRTLAGDVGDSLLGIDLGRARAAVTSLPTVASVSFDRAFPHTLVAVVVPERPVAVIRQGVNSWLVSAGGRVMASLPHGAMPALPRMWVGAGTTFTVGSSVGEAILPTLGAVTPLGAVRFPAKVASVSSSGGQLTLVLRSGIEVRLGDAHDVPLKLAVAANVLPLVDASTRYIDVSVPDRPVAGTLPTAAPTQPHPITIVPSTGGQTLKSQPEGKTAVSTGP
jgi:cell division protein FtsQ